MFKLSPIKPICALTWLNVVRFGANYSIGKLQIKEAEETICIENSTDYGLELKWSCINEVVGKVLPHDDRWHTPCIEDDTRIKEVITQLGYN